MWLAASPNPTSIAQWHVHRHALELLAGLGEGTTFRVRNTPTRIEAGSVQPVGPGVLDFLYFALRAELQLVFFPISLTVHRNDAGPTEVCTRIEANEGEP